MEQDTFMERLVQLVDRRLTKPESAEDIGKVAWKMLAEINGIAWQEEDIRDICEYAVEELIHGHCELSAPTPAEYSRLLEVLRNVKRGLPVERLWE